MKLRLCILLVVPLLLAAMPPQDQSGGTDEMHLAKTILKRVAPSIVKVVAENAKKYIATGVVTEKKYILTSSLIADHPHDKLYIETEKRRQLPVSIAGIDPESGVLLLKSDADLPPALKLADLPDTGDRVLLVGLFYNRFPAIFSGILSTVADDFLLVDAAVAPGAAGGAVVNLQGELVGIVRGLFSYSLSPEYTFRDHSAEILISSRQERENGALCYAVPAGRLRWVSDQLKRFGRIRYGWLGLDLDGLTREVGMVAPGSPAQKAGIQAGDQLLEADGIALQSNEEIMRFIRSLEPEKQVRIKLLRQGKHLVKEAQITERPRPEEFDRAFADANRDWPFDIPPDSLPPRVKKIQYFLTGTGAALGIDAIEITPELAQQFAIREGHGLMISRVYPDTASAKAGIKAGDIIVRLAGKEIASNDHLRLTLQGVPKKKPVVVELYRNRQVLKITLTPDEETDIERKIQVFQEKLGGQWTDIRRINEENKKKYEDEIRRLREELEKLKKKKGEKDDRPDN